MGTMWMLYLLAVVCSRLGYGLPLGTPPHFYPQDEANGVISGANAENSWLVIIPALALVFAAASMLFGCLWCYRHKDCKTDRGNDNQLFASSNSQLQDARRNQQPPDSGFSEPVNNNVNEDNNNGPISLREMQNIANNNAVAYIVSENEERNRAASRESVVEFEPLPVVVGPALDPLEGCADWFGDEEFPRDRLQYLREIGRGWFGRVVEGEVETAEGSQSPVAVKILSQNASLEDKARFLREARPYRELRHENILAYVASCLLEDPFVLIFELCPMTLQQYLIANRSKMAVLTEAGVPLRLICDVTSALSHMHGRGLYYGDVVASNVLVRGDGEAARCVLGRYIDSRERSPETINASTDVYSLGVLLWEVGSWGEQPTQPPLAEPTLPTPYRAHMYQVMQLCWNANQESRPTSTQVHALVNHLYLTHLRLTESPQDDGYSSCDFEDRWQRLKPNHIPVIDEHVAIIHAPSTSMVSHFTNSEEFASQTLSVDMDTAVSRSSSIMSDNLLSVQAKSESLNNLHGSYEDFRNNYLSNNQSECVESNVTDASVDPWLKEIIAGSHDDVSYYKDVSDVIKNLDNILNSEKTSSSESSHQASPSRDNLSLDCKREVAAPSSLVKSPGIRNFQNILEMGAEEVELEDEVDRDTIGTLSHSFERHSDTTSQNTLANLTPDTPSKDLQLGEEKVPDEIPIQIVQQDMPNNVVENSCRLKSTDVDVGSVSVYEQSDLSEDCQITSEIISADSAPAKSIDEKLRELDMKLVDIAKPHSITRDEMENLEINRNQILATTYFLDNEITLNSLHDIEKQNQKNTEVVLNNGCDKGTILADIENSRSIAGKIPEEIVEVIDLKQQQDSITDITSLPELTESKITENSAVNDRDEPEVIKPSSNRKDFSEIKLASEELVNDVIEKALDALSSEIVHTNLIADEESTFHDIKEVTYQNITQGNESLSQIETLPLENCDKNLMKLDDADVTISGSFGEPSLDTVSTLPIGNIPDLVQDVDVIATKQYDTDVNDDSIKDNTINDSTIYMDLINASGSVIKKDETLDNKLRQVIQTCVSETNTVADNDYTLVRNESTVYLDLPSNLINDTHEFLHVEKLAAESDLKDGNINESFPTSTPNANEGSGKNTTKSDDSGRCTPDLAPGVPLTKLEFKSVPENLSPFDSPSKSHPTDTYDENSSVLLGPFESSELFKPVKSMPDLQLPREELLAFSSNFSDINLETPSPLRDVNFLNEVPDILSEDSKFEVKSVSLTDKEENKKVESVPKAGPSTPPNSPGNFQDNTQKYAPVVDVISESLSRAPNYSVDYDNEIELNQIELQITSKLAMAENENNMNIEYSGPLTVEGLVRDDFVQEAYLAGNGQEAVIQEPRPVFALDENCMAALRNELELKLPLAQVASIEPAVDDPVEEVVESSEVGVCAPELIVNYAGVLSPITEETGRQLSAYENDRLWTASNATDSSESYLEPCNNSTDEVTDLPTGLQSGLLEHSTYTVEEPKSPRHDTYTVNRDSTSKEGTMSTDSLNVVVPDIEPDSPKSPIDDQTYTKLEEKDRISQISPFLVSPTTDTSTPYTENVTGISTLSKATIPTDGKALKQSESQNLSKATSIDSWCSNDTLFNVEDNFDDLALEGEAENDKSDDSDTLNDENNQFNDSTYNVADDKSPDSCSQDSLSANCTYTKLKTEDKTSPVAVTSSDNNESSPKDTQTRDLAYGTLMSGLASYSSCTNDLISANDELWRLPQPELVRRSPLPDDTVNLTPPSSNDLCESKNELKPKLNHEPSIKKLDSIDISCFGDVHEESNVTQPSANITDKRDSPGYHYKHMAQSVHSTPLIEIICDDSAENTEIQPENLQESQQSLVLTQMTNFQNFVNSVELRPQERSSINQTSTNVETEVLLEGESTLAIAPSEQIPSYASFEASADDRPQEVNSKSSQSINSDDFRKFESSVQERPQDLSSIIESSALLLKSECKSSEIAASRAEAGLSIDNTDGNLVIDEGRVTNLEEESQLNLDSIHYVAPIAMPFIEETEQPHSIIMTIDDNEIPQINEVNKTYDSHETQNIVNDFYDPHIKEIVNGDIIINGTRKADHKLPELVETVNFALETTVSNGFNNQTSDNKENYATLSFLSQPYEEFRGNDNNKSKNEELPTKSSQECEKIMNHQENGETGTIRNRLVHKNGNGEVVGKMANVTEDFLSNEQKYSGYMTYNELLSDIRFTGPSSEIMSTSFCGESPSEPTAPPVGESEKQNGTAEDIVKEWDSDSEDSHSTNSSSYEFVWKQRNNNDSDDLAYRPACSEDAGSADSESGTEGDEVAFEPSTWKCEAAPAKSSLRSLQRVSSLSGEGKKKVVFKRQKYHSVYEYPREVYEVKVEPPQNRHENDDNGPFEPFSQWTTLTEYAGPDAVQEPGTDSSKDPGTNSSQEPGKNSNQDPGTNSSQDPGTNSSQDPGTKSNQAPETNCGQDPGPECGQMHTPQPANMHQLHAGVALSAPYEDDFYISSSARPFEICGLTSSEFFPGKHLKSPLLDPADLTEDYPPLDFPLTPAPELPTRTPSADFTTPDSGVEDITPGSTSIEEDFKKKVEDPTQTQCWKADSASSSESVSPSSPGGEALGGLRHTRDKLKLDLPPSPHIPSPRHNRVFNFVLDKPKRRHPSDETERLQTSTTPLITTDDTALVINTIPVTTDVTQLVIESPPFTTNDTPLVIECTPVTTNNTPSVINTIPVEIENPPAAETLVKEPEMTEEEAKKAALKKKIEAENKLKAETVKGEGTVLDSGDEDSGIESSAKTSLERNKTPNVS